MAKARTEKAQDAEQKAPSKSQSGKSDPTGAKAALKAKKAAKPAGSPSSPIIDTSLAAQSAAKMVANRDQRNQAKGSTGEKRESGSFKQLKENLLKPVVQGPGGLLQPPGAQKKFNPSVGARNQVGHNQTFGADVTRTGVPRRTSG